MSAAVREIRRNLRVSDHHGGAVPWSDIDCVILDMDGTLLDLHMDNQLWGELLPRRYAALHKLNHTAARTHVREQLAQARGTLAWYCFEHWNQIFGIDLAGLEGELRHLIKPRAGALEFLRWVAAGGQRLVLATNAHPISLEHKLAQTGIAEYFSDIVSAHSLGAPKESATFWRALHQHLGFEPARVLFIDDNQSVRGAAMDYGIAHVFGIAYPDSAGPRVNAEDVHCLLDFTELTATDT